RARRDDIEDGDLADTSAMIKRHAVGNAAAAVVAGDAEMLETEGGHDLYLVLRHGALGKGGMLTVALRPATVAVAAQVWRHDREVRRQQRRHPMPADMRLRKAMQEQQRRAASAEREIDLASCG